MGRSPQGRKETRLSDYHLLTYTKITTIQRLSAWPLGKDDMQTCDVITISDKNAQPDLKMNKYLVLERS